MTVGELSFKTLMFLFALGVMFVITKVVYAGEATNKVFTTASCTGTTAAALAANQGRVSALVINDGTSVVWIKVGEVAVANEGIRLNANGGSYYITNANGNLDRAAINCITASATVVLLVVEWGN